MKPFIYISIFGLALITQVGATATNAEIPPPVVDNSDVNDNLFASQAIINCTPIHEHYKRKLKGPYGEVLKFDDAHVNHRSALNNMKMIVEGVKLLKSQTDTEVLDGSVNQTLNKLAMDTENAEKDIERVDKTVRDTDQRMSGVRTELNTYAKNVYQYHTEVIGIWQGLENKMERLESKIDKGISDIANRFAENAKNFTDVNSKLDNRFAKNAKEFQVIRELLADINKWMDETVGRSV